MKKILLASMISAMSLTAMAQSTSGTVVSISGHAELKTENDQAVVVFYVEEQDKDQAVVASRVNQKMKSGLEALKKEDAQAEFSTRGYYTYPVYADNTSSKANPAQRQIIGWRAGQYLEMKTVNLKQLASAAAAGQKLMALNGVNFGLQPETIKRLDAERITAGYRNFSDKVKIIAAAMGKKPDDASVEVLDFDGTSNELHNFRAAAAPMMLAASPKSVNVEEPSFEPGYTSLSVNVSGKVRFK